LNALDACKIPKGNPPPEAQAHGGKGCG